jgi:hypothetical protein
MRTEVDIRLKGVDDVLKKEKNKKKRKKMRCKP